MKCKSRYCDNQAELGSKWCENHSNSTTVSYNYDEWGKERWEDRVGLLEVMWKSNSDYNTEMNLIADLIIHSHDILSEQQQ